MTDLRILLLRIERHGLTIGHIVERCESQGVEVSGDCISKIRRGLTKSPNYYLGKAIERIAAEFGESA